MLHKFAHMSIPHCFRCEAFGSFLTAFSLVLWDYVRAFLLPIVTAGPIGYITGV